MFLGLLGGVLDERDNRQQNRQRRQAPVFRARQYFELEDFHKRFRLTREQVEDLMQNIGPQIEARSLRASALSVQDKVLTTLRYFASGAIYTVIADANGPLLPQLSFYNVNQPNGMPMACGCVDGTLINIIAPSEAEFQYVDRKSDHSINAIKTRRVIECAYGVFKNSFLCLKRLRHEDPVFCCEVIKTCAVIHNLRMPEDYVGLWRRP